MNKKLTKKEYPYILEKNKLFSESIIWNWERDYYKNIGIESWTENNLPYYVTSNVMMGQAYAELAVSMLEDIGKRNLDTVYILELGAGHGRFSYHFLSAFEKLHQFRQKAIPNICYVISDISEDNISFCRDNPKLKPFIEKGVLDFSYFDVKKSTNLHLMNLGIDIGGKSCSQPIIVIANYIFDSIEQELFYFLKGDVSYSMPEICSSDEEAAAGNIPELRSIYMDYNNVKLNTPPYEEKYMNDIIRDISKKYDDSYVLFPFQIMRCLKRLHSFSEEGILLLSADKGTHDIENAKVAPQFVTHNKCFSFSVNYYILRLFCQKMGGISLFPARQPESIDIGCFLMTNQPSDYTHTKFSFERFIDGRNPDVIYGLIHGIQNSDNYVTFKNIVDILYLSDFDPDEFMRILGAVYIVLPNLNSNEKRIMYECIEKVYERYYPMGNNLDLAYELGTLLLQMEMYEEALQYLEQSVLADKNTVNLSRLICCYMLKDFDKAVTLLESIR